MGTLLNRRRYMGGGRGYPADAIMTIETNPEVLAICYAQGWAAHSDYMTKSEAEAVTSIGTAFRSNVNITTFHEFQYFTSVTSLVANAFRDSSITEITLPSTITILNDRCFQNCISLSSINLDNVTNIGTLAFYNNKSLVSVNLSNCTTCGQGCFSDCSKLNNVGSVANIVTIGTETYGLFAKTKLSGVFIFYKLTNTKIPDSLFANVSGVTEVSFPLSQYTSIGPAALQLCGVTSFAVREGCTTLNNHSLSGSNFHYIDLPTTLTTWNGFAMYNNRNQEVIVSRAITPPSIGNTATSQKSFDDIPTTCKLYVPQASISAYETAAGWDRFAGRYLPIEGSWYETHRSLDPNEP